jgi:hypothetical protein
MKKTSILIATAIAMFAAPAMAQTLPVLTEKDGLASQKIETKVAPACELVSTLANPTLTIGSGAIRANYDESIKVGDVTVTCNTPNSSVQVGSTNLSNGATIREEDASVFTNSISFAARVIGSNYNWGVDSRAGSLGGNTWGSASSLGFGNGNSNRRILKAVVDIAGLSTGARLPVAGTYSGAVCVTVDPDAALNGLAAGYGIDDDQTCA